MLTNTLAGEEIKDTTRNELKPPLAQTAMVPDLDADIEQQLDR